MPEPSNIPVPRALAFDVVEWFHDPNLAARLSSRHWRRLPSRASEAVARALELCAAHGAKATFFVLGEIAERAPELVVRIAAAGHEIANAGWSPLDLAAVGPDRRAAVLAGLQRARQRLEAITGRAVVGFRSPWPVVRGDAWWRSALSDGGYAYDATDASGAATALRTIRLGAGGAGFVVPTWQLDAASPRLVGLPRRVLAAHAALFATAPGALVRELVAQPHVAIAASLGLCLGPPPARAALPAPAATPRTAVPRADVPRVALVVPLKDEEAALPSLVAELDALVGQLADVAALEFVLVDDGSTDRTWPLLRQMLGERRDVRLVQHDHNRGVAAAIATGLRATDAEVAASIDGDLSYDPAELAAMLPLLAGADVVTASPYHRRGGVANVPAWRLLLSRTLSAFYRRLLRSDVATWTSCFRVYRRAAVVGLPLEHPGFLGTAELLVRVLRRGGVVREHPCVLEARLFGSSKMKILRTIGGHLRLLWRVAIGRIS